MAMALCLTPDLDQNLMFNLSEPEFGGIFQIFVWTGIFWIKEFIEWKTNSVIHLIRVQTKKINAIIEIKKINGQC